MDVLETIRTARAWRSYSDDPVSEEDVEFLVRHAQRAGSGHNRQPWTFIAVSDRDRIDRLASFGGYTTPLRNAPLGLVLLVDRNESKRREEYNIFDCGRAVQNLHLAATKRGLAMCPQGLSQQEEAAEYFDVPDDKRVLLAFAVGHPTDEDDETIEGVPKEEELGSLGRDPLEDVLHWDRHL